MFPDEEIIFLVFAKLCEVNNQNCDIVQRSSIEGFSCQHFSSKIRISLDSEKHHHINIVVKVSLSLPGTNDSDSVLVSVSVPEAVRGKNGEMHSMISNVEGENIRVTNNHLLLLHSILEEGQSVRDPP